MVAVLLGAVLAGMMTTLVGMGGGMMLTAGLFTLMEPVEALALSGVALLVGNIHRIHLYRDEVSWPTARQYALGAFPGALLGGLFAMGVPGVFLKLGMVAVAVLATAKVVLGIKIAMPGRAVVAGGAATGFVSATAGGGGLIAGPMLLATGLTARPYVATAAVGAVSVHVGRLAAYGTGGYLDAHTLAVGGLAALAIVVGNQLGEMARRWVPEAWMPGLELGTVGMMLTASLVGLS